ncbi:unnamed protein product, partial [Symbiodinium pilosum]
MFVSLADLTQDQRQVLTSLMVFCTTKTSVDNPLLAPSGNAGRKTFRVIEEGYLENSEGFWVEDEEDRAEGFLELDEDTFWVYDDVSAAWFQRRFQGRRMRRGKGEAVEATEPGWDDQSWQEPQQDESYAAKGKGNKGKKGKGKGKWSKDGKGDGKDGHAHVATDASQPSSSFTATKASTFCCTHNLSDLPEVLSGELVKAPEPSIEACLMASPDDEMSYLARALTPTSMVLDL